MIRYVLAIACLAIALCTSGFAAEPVMTADPGYGVLYAQEQVATLPQDQFTPYLTIFGDRNDPRMADLTTWFEQNDTLRGIKSQTHFNIIYSDSDLYKDRYSKTVEALPCVRLQAVGEEKPVAEYSGNHIPMTADALAKGLNTKAQWSECFRRRRTTPPDNSPPDGLKVDPPVQPLLPPAPITPKRQSFPWGLILILGAAGGALGAAQHIKDVYYSRKG